MNTAQPQVSAGELFMRSLAVGFAYALASALTATILGPISRLAPTIDNLLIWLVTGTLVTLALSPLIQHSVWSRFRTILAAWAVLAFIRSLGLGIEGSLFKPTQAINAILGAIFGILVSLLVAWLSVRLLMPASPQTPHTTVPPRSWWGWTWRVLAVGLAYFVFYFIFGATNALLYTRSFYENNPQYGLSLPPTGVIFVAQLLRGPLFGLGSLFIVMATDAPRRRVGVWLGILLFVVGGLGPYLEVTFRSMPLGFNLATLAEIFLQNFLTGVVAVNIFKPKEFAAGATAAMSTY
ncbi:MAG: hypothetical protein ACXWNQ_00200 [Anaerolineales bacterium]